MRASIFTRFDRMENSFMDTIRKVIRQEIDEVKAEFRNELDMLSERVVAAERLAKQCSETMENSTGRKDIMNIIIRNLPERQGENILSKVNGLLKDGLKLKDVGFLKAERKVSRNPSKPGVIVAECHSSDDMWTILKAKTTLKDSRNFREVFIEKDIPAEQRTMEANIRTIVNAIGRNQLEMRGARVQLTGHRRQGHTSRDTGRGDEQHMRQDGNRTDWTRNVNKRSERDRRDDSGFTVRQERHSRPWRDNTGPHNTSHGQVNDTRRRLGDQDRSPRSTNSQK